MIQLEKSGGDIDNEYTSQEEQKAKQDRGRLQEKLGEKKVV